jgi:DNA topoisomerase II
VHPPLDDLCFNLYMQDYLANELQMAFEKLMNQARFVKMIVNKELVISNRKKVDIVLDLRKHKFRVRPFSKTSTNTGEEIEPAEEDNEEEGTQTDFDYLLGMAISSLTKEKVCLR